MKKATKAVVKKPEAKKQEKIFLAYNADTGELVQGFDSLGGLKASWMFRSSTNADLAWVAVETDVTGLYTLQNKVELKKV